MIREDQNETIVDLGFSARPWQLAVNRGLKRFSVLIVHRRGGKTVLAVMTLVRAALCSTKEKAHFAYLAPFRGQAKAVAWDYVKGFASKVPGVKINEGELWVEFPNGSQIRLFGADNPDSLRGIYLDGIAIDEVADLKPQVWGEIIRPALADRKGWALFIGTPKGINLLSELYYAALTDPDWYAGLYRASDTGALDQSELDLARKSMTENQYRQEFECDFSASVDNQLITIDLVLAASKKHIAEREYSMAPKIIGVDVARYGGDRSCIIRRQGLAVFPPRVFNGIDNMELAGQVAREIDEWNPDAVFIDSGRGEGVIDRLRQLRYHVIPVDFGGKPLSDKFENHKAEMWWSMAEWLKNGGALPDLPELKADLCGPTYSYANARGKFELESKDDMRKRGLKSPDIADALACTWAYPVAPRQNQSFHSTNGRTYGNGVGRCVTDDDT